MLHKPTLCPMGEIMLTSMRNGKLSSSFKIADKAFEPEYEALAANADAGRLRQLMLMLGMLSFTIVALQQLGCFFRSVSVLLSRKS